MSTKKTIKDLEKISQSRNHQLVSTTVPTHVMSGKITVRCFCGCLFTTSARSYIQSINGCPECKKRNTSKQWKGKKRTSLILKTQTKEISRKRRGTKNMNESSPYGKIKNKEDLITFLKLNSNAYNDFMLFCIQREEINPLFRTIGESPLQRHHIIPFFAGGCDQVWNMVYLKTEEHQTAHQLRYDVYQESGDLSALKFFKGPISFSEILKERQKLGRETQKREKKGRFSPEQQATSGKIGGTKQTEKKTVQYILKQGPLIRKCIEEGSIWVNKETQEIVTIKPNAIKLIYEFQLVLANSLPDGKRKTDLLAVQRTTFSSSIARVIKKERKSAYGFSLKS